MKITHARWTRWQRGQALVEYWPTIPASILIMLMASGIVTWFNKSILRTVDALNPTDLTCQEQADEAAGSDIAYLGGHTIQLIGNYYDEEADQTTVAYIVINSGEHDISHVTLGLPKDVADQIVSASEAYEWVDDPTTGVTGVKFDTEYGTPQTRALPHLDGLVLTGRHRSTSPMDSRTVLLTLAGSYDWSLVEISIKAAPQVFTSVITAPVSIRQGTEEECAL